MKPAEVAGAVLTGLAVMWSFNKIDYSGLAAFKWPEPPAPQPPPTQTLTLRVGDNCINANDPRLGSGLTCVNGTVRPFGWKDPQYYRPDGKYTWKGYLKFVDSSASTNDYYDYLGGN